MEANCITQSSCLLGFFDSTTWIDDIFLSLIGLLNINLPICVSLLLPSSSFFSFLCFASLSLSLSLSSPSFLFSFVSLSFHSFSLPCFYSSFSVSFFLPPFIIFSLSFSVLSFYSSSSLLFLVLSVSFFLSIARYPTLSRPILH